MTIVPTLTVIVAAPLALANLPDLPDLPVDSVAQAAAPEPPRATRSLRSFGAVGDGNHDDSAALQRAIAGSGSVCLDGEGRSYVVRMTLRAEGDLCLRNASILQRHTPAVLGKYVRATCPVISDPEAVIDCGDPSIPEDEREEVLRTLSLRTLFVRPAAGGRRVQVLLSNLHIDRGSHPAGGSRGEAAGIWIDGADRVALDRVEISGSGKGYGLLIDNSDQVSLVDLHVHDLVWAPFAADLPGLDKATLKAAGWNSAAVHEFGRGSRPGQAGRFRGVRVQEQLSCVFLTRVRSVSINNMKIERCLARLPGGDIPWQADGLGIGPGVHDVRLQGGLIDTSWEGVDIAASAPSARISITGLEVRNSFAVGIKLGHQLHDVIVSDARISHSGLAGIAIHGPARHTRIKGATILDTGIFLEGPRPTSPWPIHSRAAIRIDRGFRNAAPFDTVIASTHVSNPHFPRAFAFALRDEGGTGIRLVDFHAQDFSVSEVHRAVQTP